MKKNATDLPPDFTISQRVKVWAQLRHISQHELEQHLEYFVLSVQAAGLRYVNWDSALQKWILKDYAGVKKPKTFSANVVERAAEIGLQARPGEEMGEFMRRVANARNQ